MRFGALEQALGGPAIPPEIENVFIDNPLSVMNLSFG
jgi:hypothetical protein